MSKTARTPYRKKDKNKSERTREQPRTVKSNASDAAGAMSSSEPPSKQFCLQPSLECGGFNFVLVLFLF